MKKLLLILPAVLLLAVACGVKNQTAQKQSNTPTGPTTSNVSFSGTYEWDNGDNEMDGLNHATFSLDLTEGNTGEVTGFFCGVYKGGRRIEGCDDDSKFSGKAQGNSLTVSFKSGYSGVPVTASLKKNTDNTISWKIISSGEGDVYMPDEAIMTLKDDSAKTQKNKVYGYIKKIYLSQGKQFVDISEVELFDSQSDAGIKVMIADKQCATADECTIPSGAPYVHKLNKIKTLEVSPGSKIIVHTTCPALGIMNAGNGSDGPSTDENGIAITFAKLQKLYSYHPCADLLSGVAYYTFTLDAKGKVVSIEEPYLP